MITEALFPADWVSLCVWARLFSGFFFATLLHPLPGCENLLTPCYTDPDPSPSQGSASFPGAGMNTECAAMVRWQTSFSRNSFPASDLLSLAAGLDTQWRCASGIRAKTSDKLCTHATYIGVIMRLRFRSQFLLRKYFMNEHSSE